MVGHNKPVNDALAEKAQHQERLIEKGRAVHPWQKRELLEKLLDAWLQVPEMRLGQLIDNAIFPSEDSPGDRPLDLYYCEDSKLIEAIQTFAKLHTKV